MAVVQISKIQVRRGQKNSNSGVPQLSSAEFAWAVDSQELFIGNGSVAEGAPYVGNTKILTEHDNILDLASSYQFASNDTSITLSVSRSLQSKEDETVSVADFGAIGDGSTDCTLAFETAFTQLFRNVNTNYRKVLLVPNGEYLFLSDLRIPSNVILRGETPNGAVLNIGSNNIRFITSTGLELADFSSSNRPTGLNLSNLTINRVSGQLVLSGVADSHFDNITFRGEYVLGNAVPSLATTPAAVFWENTLSGTKTNNIKFNNCLFESNSIGVKCSQTTVYETNISFSDCEFFVGHVGIFISGVSGQSNKWKIFDCEFEEIASQAIRSTNGYDTLVQRTKFKNCANGTGTAASPEDNIVYFGEKRNNILVDCTFDRQQAAGVVSSVATVAVNEVYNSDKVSIVDRNFGQIFLSDSFRPLAVFSAFNKFYTINYFLELGTHSRVGELSLSIGDQLGEIAISDHYQYSPTSSTSTEGALMTNFEFQAELRDNDADSGIDTIVLSYKNPLASGQTGSISFDVAYGV
jgi:hypothetical protein